MKTSMNELQEIEDYLLHPHNEESVLMEARLLLEPELQEKTAWQQKTYTLVQHYGRKKLRQEIEAVHQELFTNDRYTSFRKKIMRLFRNQK